MRQLIALFVAVLFVGAGACGSDDLPRNPGDYFIIENDESVESPGTDDDTESNDTDTEPFEEREQSTDEELVRMWSCIICEVAED